MDNEDENGVEGRVAWDDPATRSAFAKYRRNSTRLFWIGCAVLLGGFIWAGNMNPNSTGVLGSFAAGAIGLGATIVVGGAVGISRSGFMRGAFRKNPWLQRRVDYRIATNLGNGEPALLIHPDEFGPEAVYSVPSTVWRFRSLPQGADLPILFIKAANRGAILPVIEGRRTQLFFDVPIELSVRTLASNEQVLE